MLTARWLAASLGVSLVLLAVTAEAATPTQTLRTLFARASAALVADPDQPLEERRRAVRELVNEAVDVREAAALALGRQWLARTPAEQAELASLFADLWERGYVAVVGSKARVTDGLSIRFLGETRDGAHTIVHTTVLTRAGSEMSIDYRMAQGDGGRWTVRDVVVDGLSLAANYRAQFQRVLQLGGYPELLERLRAQAYEVTPVVASVPSAPVVVIATATAATPVATVNTAPAAAAPTAAPAPPRRDAPVPTNDPVPVAIAVAPSVSQSVPTPMAAVEPTTAPPAPIPLVPAATPTGLDPPSSTAVDPPRSHTVARAAPARVVKYWVQVGAYRTVEATSEVVNRLRGQAVTVLTAVQRSGGRPEWVARVVVGPFAGRAQAASKVRELKARGYRPFIAQSSE